MEKWQRIDDGNNITKVGFRTLTEKTFRRNDGTIAESSIVGRDNDQAAGVVAITSDNKVVIARQFRCGPEEIFEEIPGGMVDAGETPEQAVRRELLEEVGYTAGKIIYLGKTYVNAWDTLVRHYFLATDCTFTGTNNPEGIEEIEIDTISISQFIKNAKDAKMTDVQAVFLALDHLHELEGAS